MSLSVRNLRGKRPSRCFHAAAAQTRTLGRGRVEPAKVGNEACTGTERCLSAVAFASPGRVRVAGWRREFHVRTAQTTKENSGVDHEIRRTARMTSIRHMQVLTYVYCYPLPKDTMSLVLAAARRHVPRVRADTAQFLAPISGFHVGNRPAETCVLPEDRYTVRLRGDEVGRKSRRWMWCGSKSFYHEYLPNSDQELCHLVFGRALRTIHRRI